MPDSLRWVCPQLMEEEEEEEEVSELIGARRGAGPRRSG
jgi:hypothetical protein